MIQIKAALPHAFTLSSKEFFGGLAMTNAVENESDLAKCHPAPLMERSSASGFQIYLIGIIVLGVAALATYQFLSCSGCY